MAEFKKRRSVDQPEVNEDQCKPSAVVEIAGGISFVLVVLIVVPLGWILLAVHELIKLTTRLFNRPKATPTAERAETD